MEKFKQNHETSQQFEVEPRLPKIETVHLTNFGELHDYTVGDAFSNPIFEVKIPSRTKIFGFILVVFLIQSVPKNIMPIVAGRKIWKNWKFGITDYKKKRSMF